MLRPPFLGLALVAWILVWLTADFVVSAKRFHDRGMSGWWSLWRVIIILGPLALSLAIHVLRPDLLDEPARFTIGRLLALYCGGTALIFFVILYCLPGQKGDNRFGPDPLASKTAA